MSPRPEPKTCGEMLASGKICGKPAMYKLNEKGFCESHKPGPRMCLALHPRGEFRVRLATIGYWPR